MGKFDGILICTDLDGTLINSGHSISRENLDAIEYFKSEGGAFTFVTGRVPMTTGELYSVVRPNVPVGCINGGAIYDFAKNEYVWLSTLGDSAIDMIDFVAENMPDIGIQVDTANNIYFSKNNDGTEYFRKRTGVPNTEKHYRDIEEPISKVLFLSMDNERILELADLLKTHPLYGDFDFVRSEATLYELLPKGNSKGNVMKRLVEYLGLDMQRTIAIGDYDNDVSMLRAAKLGIAVANAVESAKAAADLVTVSNDEHAIAKVIYDIDSGAIVI